MNCFYRDVLLSLRDDKPASDASDKQYHLDFDALRVSYICAYYTLPCAYTYHRYIIKKTKKRRKMERGETD